MTSKKSTEKAVQRTVAEGLYTDELAFLRAIDDGKCPHGWKLSPRQVVTFISGSNGDIKAPDKLKLPKGMPRRMEIAQKFVGDIAIVERSVVTLAGERGLLLAGEPGTAKSMLSELLSAAISGCSTNTVQGTAGTTEEHLRYGWNYGLLLAKGPCDEALVPSPVLRAMETGSIVRLEEITRCLPEIQDALVSIMSERRIEIPEFGRAVSAAPGFNILATANIRDRGVSEMSAALKRRFNFESVHPIAESEAEIELVSRQAQHLLAKDGLQLTVDRAVIEALVTAFRDLRSGTSSEGWTVERPSTVMSTAECVGVASALVRQNEYFPRERHVLRSLPGHLLGVVLKDESEDRGRLLAYWDGAVKRRADSGSQMWKELFEERSQLTDSDA